MMMKRSKIEKLKTMLNEAEQRYGKYNFQLEKFNNEHSIHTFRSVYIGCRCCGSKLKIDLVPEEKCPLCSTDLRSPSILEDLKTLESKCIKAKKEIANIAMNIKLEKIKDNRSFTNTSVA